MQKTLSRGFPALFAASFLIFSCGSAPRNQPLNSEDSVVVKVPSNGGSRGFFSSIDSKVIDALEIGSPQSLKQAVQAVRNNDNHTDAEKTVLFVADGMMSLLWPSERPSWNVPEITSPNQYTECIKSARQGIYDLSTNSSDFLSTFLPTLSVTVSPSLQYLDRARQAAEQALSRRKNSVAANYIMGKICLLKDDWQGAAEYFSAAISGSRGTKEIIAALAKAEHMGGEYEKSLKRCESVINLFPQDTELLELCAQNSYALRDWEKTERYVVRILMLEPEKTEFILMRARVLIVRKDFIRASSLLDACGKSSPNNKDYLLLRAELQRDWNKNNNGALETVTRALTLYPGDPDTMLLASEIASLLGTSINGQESIALAEKVLAADGTNIRAMKIYIAEKFKRGEAGKAYEMSSRLAALASSDNEILFSHIDICIALRRTDEAFKIASKIYNATPSDENAQQAYIKVLMASGQRSAAAQMIDSLLPSANQRMKSFLLYERSYLAAGEDATLADLRSSLTANPRNKDSLYRLYEIYYSKRDWRRAQYYLKQVVALDPANSSYLKRNAELDRLLGK